MVGHKAPSPDCAQTPEPRTRSGRISKPPVRYEPVEQVEDDYAVDDYDTDESDIKTDAELDANSDEDSDDEEDADDDGNLDGFVVSDKSESDSDCTEDGKPPVPIKKRPAVPVKKRTTARK